MGGGAGGPQAAWLQTHEPRVTPHRVRANRVGQGRGVSGLWGLSIPRLPLLPNNPNPKPPPFAFLPAPPPSSSLHRYPRMTGLDAVSCCFAASSRDHPVHLWDACGGEVRCSYRGYNDVDEPTAAYSLAFSPDGARLAAGYNKWVGWRVVAWSVGSWWFERVGLVGRLVRAVGCVNEKVLLKGGGAAHRPQRRWCTTPTRVLHVGKGEEGRGGRGG